MEIQQYLVLLRVAVEEDTEQGLLEVQVFVVKVVVEVVVVVVVEVVVEVE